MKQCYLARCLEPGYVCHSITTRETPTRRMKETLFTRHRNTVESMMLVENRKATLQEIHTEAVNKAVKDQKKNIVLADLPHPINDSEKYLTRRHDLIRRHILHEAGLLQTYAQIVSTQYLPPEMAARLQFFGASRPSLPAVWLALLLTKVGDVESNPGPTTHTNKHTPVIWICDLCHKQINKKQTTIRCNHIHWVHLKCTHIQPRQYKPDWRCTIHTPTQNVTTTPSTDNITPHHKQTTTHPLTNNNQPKDKNIVILQININGIRGTKNLVHNIQPDIITIQDTKLTQKAKTPKIPHYITIRTDREHTQGGGGASSH